MFIIKVWNVDFCLSPRHTFVMRVWIGLKDLNWISFDLRIPTNCIVFMCSSKCSHISERFPKQDAEISNVLLPTPKKNLSTAVYGLFNRHSSRFYCLTI